MKAPNGDQERPATRTARHPRDLRTEPLAVATRQDWEDPEAAVQALFGHAEAKAIEAIDWYLAVKRPKKRVSRLLRAAAIVLASAGALEPVVTAPWAASGRVQWGYLLLGLAAACVAFDRFFGISTGWMRCMQSAQTLQTLLEEFQYDWAAACAAPRANNLAETVPERLALLRAFSAHVTGLIRGETAEWAQEFNFNLAQLEAQTTYAGTDRHASGGPPVSAEDQDEPRNANHRAEST
jgi:hypothetical protein